MDFLTPNILISIFVAALALIFQLCFFLQNLRKLKKVSDFFARRQNYEDYEVSASDETQLNELVADENTHLHNLIVELNEYTHKNHGTTDFSVIQNKTERRLNTLYEDATSRIAFPTYIGLMGTFSGVFLGLWFFMTGLKGTSDGAGITDETIGNLISGVLVSMITSFIGLLLTTLTHHMAAEVQKKIGEDKNQFYEFIQNELMPSLGVSMVAALNKLHHTINMFEPSFNRVIEHFQSTFDKCTSKFGNAFEQNVVAVSEAVRVMGQNMDKINQNVDLNERLIKTMQSKKITASLDAFVNASYSYGKVVENTQKFEELASIIEKKTTELIDVQQNYNESLKVPLAIANRVNQILSRVTEFENSINALGRSIENTDLIANSEIKALNQAINAIKNKQKLAVSAMEVSDGHLANIFDMQAESINRLGREYEKHFESYAEKFQNQLDTLEKEIIERRRAIVAALEEKFSLDKIQQDFSQLKNLNKLESIEDLLSSINENSVRTDVDKSIVLTQNEVEAIHRLLNKILDEASKKQETQSSSGEGGLFGRFWGGRNRQ